MTGLTQVFSSDWAHSLGWTLLYSLWEIALVALSVALLMAALRRRSANARYLVAVVGLLAMVVLPGVTYCIVPARVDPTIVDPIEQPNVEVSTPPPSANTLDVLPTIVDMPPVSDQAPDAEAVASVPSVPSNETSPAIPLEQLQIPDTFTSLLGQVTRALSPWTPWLVIVWLLGVSSLSVWNLGGWIAAQRLKHLATMPVDGPLRDRFAELARRMKVSRPVQMVRSCLVDVPIVVGWLRPVILVPVGIVTGFPPAQLDAILAHELAHIRRHDYLVNLFQTLAETLLFYHPGVWWISRRIRIEREHSCDDAAVAVCGSNVDYAAALTALEESRAAPRMVMATTGSEQGGTTLCRVRRVLGLPGRESLCRRKLLGGVLGVLLPIALLACVAVPVAMMRAADREESAHTESADAGSTQVSGTLRLEARVVGIDGKPVESSSITFWKSVDPRTLKKSSTRLWPDDFEVPHVWRDSATGKTWTPLGHSATSDRVTQDHLTQGDYRVTAFVGHVNPKALAVSGVIRLDGSREHTVVTVPVQSGPSLDIEVVDAQTGKAIEYPAIRLTRPDGLPLVGWSGAWWVRPGGSQYTFEHLAPGDYTLEVAKWAHSSGEPEYSRYGPSKIELAVGVSRQVTVNLRERPVDEEEAERRWPWAVTGTVTDEEGQGLEGVTIRAHCGAGTLRQQGATITDRHGKYTLRFGPGMRILDEETGKWGAGLQAATISASKPGLFEKNLYRQGGLMMADKIPPEDNPWRVSPEKVILPGKPYRVDFVMSPAAVIRGTLVDEKDRPLADQRISAVGEDSWPSTNVLASARTDSEGAFEMDSFPTGLPIQFEHEKVRTKRIAFTKPGRHEIKLKFMRDPATGKGRLLILDDAVAAADNLIIPGERVGPYVLGHSTLASILSEDTPERRREFADEGLHFSFDRDGPLTSVTVSGDASPYATRDGIRIGSKEEEVRGRYGRPRQDIIRSQPPKIEIPALAYDGITFAVADGRVAAVIVAAEENSPADEASPPEEIRHTLEEPVEQVLMKTYEVGGLEIEAGFVPDADSIMLHEPSFVTFRVTNRFGKPYQFDIGGDNRGSVRHNDFRITAVDAAGRAVRDPYSYTNFGGMVQRVTLAPGKTHSQRLYLGHWLDLERPGQYTVTCKRTLEKHGRGPQHPPLAVSSQFTVTVTPQDAVAMAAVIARLGEQIREGEVSKLREATIALADVDDVRVIPHLAASLARGDYQNRIPAIKGLGRYGNDAAVEALRSALTDNDHAVRSAAGQAIQKRDKGDQVARQLLKQLASDSADVRRLAARALGETGSEAAIEPLIAALKDPGSPVRCAAAVSLGELGREEAADPLQQSLKRDDRALRVAAADGLRRLTGRFDPKWVTATIRETTYINDRTFHESIRLTRLYAGSDAAAALIGCLRFDDPSPRGHYNFYLILAIHHCKDGPDCYDRWKHDANRDGTKEEIENNQKILDELKQFAAEATGDEIDARPAANGTTERTQETTEAGPNLATSLTDNPRQRFLEIERVARLPEAEQAKELKRLYTELAPRYMSPFVTGILSWYPRYILNRADSKHGDGNPERWAQQLEDAAKDLSPEEVADKIDIGLWLNIAAQARVLQVFRRHEKVVTAMIAAGLASRDKAQVERAAATISTLGLHAFTDELLDLLLANGEASEAAHDALLFMRDPDIAKPLLEHVGKDPSSLARCAGLLQGPFYGKAADPLLLGLLGTPDKELRYHAVRAVYECRDPELAPFVAKFARDDETRFRVAVAYMTKNLPDESFKAVRAQLLPLLGDKDESVRFEALRSFGLKRDMAAGPVILETLRREQLGGRFLLHVMHALDALAGETFGYNMHNWGPASQGNRKAIGEFEKWLKNADSRDGFAADLVEEWTGVVTDEEGRPLEGVIVKMCGVEWFDEGRWHRNRRLACYFPRPPASDKAGRFTVQFKEGLFELPFDERTTRVNFWFDKEGFAPTYLPAMSPRSHDVKVVMKRGIRVSGTVKRPADGKLAPAPAAVVSLQCLSGDRAQQVRFFDDPLSAMKDTTEGCDLPYRKRVSTDVEGRYTFRLSPPPNDKKWCLFCSGQAVMLGVKEGQQTQGPDFVVEDEVGDGKGQKVASKQVVEPDPKDETPQVPWGEAVDGLQCRLHVEKSELVAGQWPVLLVDVKNGGKRVLTLGETPDFWVLECDGIWYQAGAWFSGEIKFLELTPSRTHRGFPLNLETRWKWHAKGGKKPLAFGAGKHKLRVALHPAPKQQGPWMPVLSNPVEIEVVEPNPKDPAQQAPWGETVEGVQLRLRPDATAWKVDETPMFKIDVRNDGPKSWQLLGDPVIYEIEVDGRWYRRNITIGVVAPPTGPGEKLTVAFRADGTILKHVDRATGGAKVTSLEFPPGRHTIRVGCSPASGMNQIRLVSNAIEIEVLEIDPKDVAPSGEAVEHESDTVELKLARGENAITSATVREGQSAAEILNALGHPDYVDDDPWFSYKASPEGKYVLLFEEAASKTDAKPDMGSVTLWGVLGPGAEVKEAVFLLPHRLRGKACGDFIALRVRSGPGTKKVATVALGMSSSDVLRMFRPARDLAPKEGYVLFPSIDNGKFLLVFSARDNNESDESKSDRLSQVIYRPGGDEKPVYLLPFKKRGQAIPAVHKAVLNDDRHRSNPAQLDADDTETLNKTGGHRTNDHRPRPPQPTESDRGRAWWKQMEDRDAKLLTQFEQITVGMSPNQVRGVMGMDAQVKRDNLWGFKLSQASDTPNEVDWVLLVAFENGKVSSKQTTYTCLYTTVRE